jgi:hypothetical protein
VRVTDEAKVANDLAPEPLAAELGADEADARSDSQSQARLWLHHACPAPRRIAGRNQSRLRRAATGPAPRREGMKGDSHG